ncbi:MAG: aldo/keto reductase [Candidatus Paracaedibacteraceae bacterium]|nr:aldo/keto reductase [Candidatus Paracaedibacteraceae bacterium]
MPNRFSIGTANFSQPYGVFSSGHALSSVEIDKILSIANQNNITTFDTASAYGDLSPTFKNLIDAEIVTKFSVLSDKNHVIRQLNKLREHLSIDSIYGILIHDPQHLNYIEKQDFQNFVSRLQTEAKVKHVGISVYTPAELFQFSDIYMPSLIQVPLNPLNQAFLEDKVQDFIQSNRIETHARSLFLQGILLNQDLPAHLSDLSELVKKFKHQSQGFKNELSAILCWALKQKLITKWVVGLMSAAHLTEILSTALEVDKQEAPDFSFFKNNYHPLIDPRNWKKL